MHFAIFVVLLTLAAAEEEKYPFTDEQRAEVIKIQYDKVGKFNDLNKDCLKNSSWTAFYNDYITQDNKTCASCDNNTEDSGFYNYCGVWQSRKEMTETLRGLFKRIEDCRRQDDEMFYDYDSGRCKSCKNPSFKESPSHILCLLNPDKTPSGFKIITGISLGLIIPVLSYLCWFTYGLQKQLNQLKKDGESEEQEKLTPSK